MPAAKEFSEFCDIFKIHPNGHLSLILSTDHIQPFELDGGCNWCRDLMRNAPGFTAISCVSAETLTDRTAEAYGRVGEQFSP